MLSVDNILNLPIELKVYIASAVAPDHTVWTWFAIHDSQFMQYSVQNRRSVVNTLTEYIINNNTEEWKVFGRLHREDDQPAHIKSIITNKYYIKLWYINGKQHRDAKDPITNLILAAEITTGGLNYWYKHGRLFREKNLPTITSLVMQYWMYSKHGMHRKYEPAIIYTAADGSYRHEYHFRNMPHRWSNSCAKLRKLGENTDLPAVIHYSADGSIERQEWYYFGKFVRSE